MRLTDILLLALLGLAILGAHDPAAASDLIDHMGAQLHALIPAWPR